MTPSTRVCLQAMATVRRWLEIERGCHPPWEKNLRATLRACIEALNPARNPRLKRALSAVPKKQKKRNP